MLLGPRGPWEESHSCRRQALYPADTGCGRQSPSPAPHAGRLLRLPFREHQHIPPCASVDTELLLQGNDSHPPRPCIKCQRVDIGVCQSDPAILAPAAGAHPPFLRLGYLGELPFYSFP